ncbi:hypothetical protein PBRA_001782 [Plasmodiophora brassicae]|uniref:Uncharacterized protein n=1 Tax=Plasmodiophora brassicae TaxID=37360 RepID=A0A0G4IZF5_PLABS|nr:hypothetical protein PBRA_001782 [Plasmodiophora brassicae]
MSASDDPAVLKQRLAELRVVILNLQKDIARQEGDMMDMKRAIAQRMTKEQAEARLAAMTTPAQVKDKIERVRADLLAVVNGKATRQEVGAALDRKASSSDMAQLSAEVDRISAFLRLHARSDSAAAALAASKTTRKESRKVTDLHERIARFGAVCDDLERKFNVLASVSAGMPDALRQATRSIEASRALLHRVEAQVDRSRSEQQRNVYEEMLPRVLDMSARMAAADDILRGVDVAERTARANRADLATLQQPFMARVTDLQAETRMFFRELVRLQAQFADLAAQVGDRRQQQERPAGPAMIPWSKASPRQAKRDW